MLSENSTLNQCTITSNSPPSDHPRDFGYYLCGPILTALIVTGLISNSIFLTILSNIRPIPVANYYIIPLCLSDLGVLISSFFMFNLPILLYGRMETYGSYVKFYPFLTYFSNFAYTCCVWLIVSLSVERYFALCYPLTHRIYNARRRSILISSTCVLTSALYNIPRYLEPVTRECLDSTTGRLVPVLEQAEFSRHSKLYFIVYKLVLGKVFLSLGPLVVLCVMSFRMWRLVEQSKRLLFDRIVMKELNTLIESRKREATTTSNNHQLRVPDRTSCSKLNSTRSPSPTATAGGSQRKKGNGLTYTLFCVVLKFMICHILPTVLDLCETFMDERTFNQSLVNNLVDISTLLVVANSSVNFFIHLWCSRHFRKNMRVVLTPRQTGGGSDPRSHAVSQSML